MIKAFKDGVLEGAKPGLLDLIAKARDFVTSGALTEIASDLLGEVEQFIKELGDEDNQSRSKTSPH